MFEQFENIGIQRAELIPIAYRCAKEVIQDYKEGKIKRKDVQFPQFLEDLCNKLETYFPVKISINPGEVEITKDSLEQYLNEVIAINNFSKEQIGVVHYEPDPKSKRLEKLPIVSIKPIPKVTSL